MQTPLNPWDAMADPHYQEKGNTESFSPGTIPVLWPAILKELKDLPKKKSTHIVDFGCGTGDFCRKLCREGYRATGIDSSNAMLAKAYRITAPGLSYIHGDESALENLALKADAITSLMVMQFIEDLDQLIKASRKALKQDGLVVTAVYNPQFIERCIKEGKKFQRLPEHPQRYEARNGITAHIRDESWYKSEFEKAGFKIENTNYPPYTEEFLRAFKVDFPTDVPEYMILTFRKNCQSKPSTE